MVSLKATANEATPQEYTLSVVGAVVKGASSEVDTLGVPDEGSTHTDDDVGRDLDVGSRPNVAEDDNDVGGTADDHGKPRNRRGNERRRTWDPSYRQS